MSRTPAEIVQNPDEVIETPGEITPPAAAITPLERGGLPLEMEQTPVESSPPRQLVRAHLIAAAVALRFHHIRLGGAMAEDGFEHEAAAAGAEVGAVAGVVAVVHARAGWGALERGLTVLLILLVELRDVFEERVELGGVELVKDSSDSELGRGGAHELEDVRVFRVAGLVDRFVVFDERGEVVPRRGDGIHRLLERGRTECGQDRVVGPLADVLDQKLAPRGEHHAGDLADVGIRAGEDLVPYDRRSAAGGSALFHEE